MAPGSSHGGPTWSLHSGRGLYGFMNCTVVPQSPPQLPNGGAGQACSQKIFGGGAGD